LYYHREQNQFGDKVDPETKIKVKPTHCFTLFKELIYPEHLYTNYLEEFNKMQGFSKTLPPDQQVFFLMILNPLTLKSIVFITSEAFIKEFLDKY